MLTLPRKSDDDWQVWKMLIDAHEKGALSGEGSTLSELRGYIQEKQDLARGDLKRFRTVTLAAMEVARRRECGG